MIQDVFRHLFKQSNGVSICNGYALFRKPLELFDMQSYKSVLFDSYDEMLAYEIDGKTIRELIDKADMSLFDVVLDGGRGSGGGGKSFKFGHASGGSGTPDDGSSGYELPARANTMIKTKNTDSALNNFQKNHANDKGQEHAYAVDSNGYVTQYRHGDATSVAIAGRKGEMVYHNHPSGGNFSDSDIISTSMTPAKGIVATGTREGRQHTYTFTKGNHYDSAGMVKAMKTANPKGKDYNDATDKWLRKNQKTYGYKYSHTSKPIN